MQTTARVSAPIRATPARLYQYLVDYRRAPLFIGGLQSLKPLGRRTKGSGARFAAVMKVGPSTFEGTIELGDLEPNRRVAWVMLGDEPRRVNFELSPSDGTTNVEVEVSYERPGGIGGLVLAPVVEQAVRSTSRDALQRLKELAEAGSDDSGRA
jgi:uncharacterized membrane protein